MNSGKYKILIVEDEAPAVHSLQNLLESYPDFSVQKISGNGREALKLIKSEKFDLIFLDINIPFMDGLEMIKKIKNPPYFIIISARSDRAIEAFDTGAVDYLHKPVNAERFARAISRFKIFCQGGEHRSGKILKFLENRNAVYLEIDMIKFLEQMGRHTAIHTEERIFKTINTLANLEEELLQDGFIRVHKKYIVNRKFILKRIHQGSGQYVLQLSDSEDTEIPTGRKYLQNIKDLSAAEQ